MAKHHYNMKKLRNGSFTADMVADMAEHVMRALGINFNEDLNDHIDVAKTQPGALEGLVRAFQAVEGLQADGLAGSSTLRRVRDLQSPGKTDGEKPARSAEELAQSALPAIAEMGQDRQWPLFLPTDESLRSTDSYRLEYPATSRAVDRIFGKPGAAKSRWYKQNIIVCRDKKGDRPTLPGVSTNRWVKVHRLVEPFFREAMRRAREACPEYFELFGGEVRFGAFNYRHMRHDPKMPLSKHSWGICCDIEPKWNRGITYRKGKCPDPWSKLWWKVYPRGIPKAIVHAFYSCGFAWGGDWDADGIGSDQTYSDPMHFQWYGNKAYAKSAKG